MTTTKITTRVLLASFAGAVALLAFGTAGAGAAPSASLEATKGCYLQVINDWLDNNQVDRVYAIPCYSQAIQHLSQYPDVQGYSSAEDDIRRAWLAAVRQDRGGGPTSSSGGGGSPSDPKNPSSAGSQETTTTTTPEPSFFTSLGHKLGPGDAQTVPLPLLVLGGLALLLLLAAAGTWIARRMQARRATPAPAPAPRRP